MNVVRQGRWRGQAGLTLIETLLALAILGIALVVLVASAGQALSVVRRARHFETARHLMEILQLENPVTNVEEVAGTSEAGGFDSPYEAYTWERSVEPWLDMFGEETGYYVVRTRILWSDQDPAAFEEFVTGVFAATRATGVVARAEETEEMADPGVAGGGIRAVAPRSGARGQPRDEPAERMRPGRGGEPAMGPVAPAPRPPQGFWDRVGRAFAPEGRDRNLPRRAPAIPGDGRPRSGRAFPFPQRGGIPAVSDQPSPSPTPRMPRGQSYDGPPLPPGF